MDSVYGPVMVVAGPGTGKTTVLTLRIANILAKTDAKPEEILALTFTDNGAKNMREKLREIIGDASFRVNIFTFHSFANHMRGLYPENFSKIGERMPAGEAEKFEIIEDIISNQSFRELRVSQYGVSIGKIAKRISDLKRELISPKDLEKLIKSEEKSLDAKEKESRRYGRDPDFASGKKEKYFIRIKEFARAFELYEKELQKRSLYDFDDAILELIRALKENPDMASEMRESFQFVLADEHQDANGAQNEILKMFKAEGVEKPNVFVVGDDKQSIFRFQGASLEHFYNFSREFKGAQKISLNESYRSHRIILDASHSLISKDDGAHQKLKANVQYEEKKLEIGEYTDYTSELFDIARKVKEIISKRGNRETIAIIARGNKALFDIAPYLEREKVKFNIKGERSFFSDFHYRKLVYLFEALVNPYDGALLKALYAGYFEADIADVIALANAAKSRRRDFAALFLEGNVNHRVKELIAKAKRMPALEFLKEIKDEIQKNRSTFEYDVLRAVYEEAGELTKKNRGATLDDLVEHLKFLEKHNLAPLASGAEMQANVELLSIHRAKGLEYDYVFIIDAVAKRFEGSGRRGDLLQIPGIGVDTELAEERRLLYVAITRAKKHASISYSLTGDEGGDTSPSVLLSQIDPKFAQKVVHPKESVRADLPDIALPPTHKRILREAFLTRNFSVSALNNFLKCPWKYVARNLLLVPEPTEWSALLGTACHNALKIFHINAKKGKALGKKELKRLINQCILAEPFTASDLPVALEKAERSIFAYADSFVPFKKGEKISVENSEAFVYRVKDGRDDFGITVTGKIDLSKETNGRTRVIDFKTKKRMTRNEIKGETKNSDGDEMRQLQFYKFLLENTKKDCNVESGTLTFLMPERGKVLSETFELNDTDKAKIEETIRKSLLSIYRLDFRGETCTDKNCEYCSLYKGLV